MPLLVVLCQNAGSMFNENNGLVVKIEVVTKRQQKQQKHIKKQTSTRYHFHLNTHIQIYTQNVNVYTGPKVDRQTKQKSEKKQNK